MSCLSWEKFPEDCAATRRDSHAPTSPPALFATAGKSRERRREGEWSTRAARIDGGASSRTALARALGLRRERSLPVLDLSSERTERRRARTSRGVFE